MVNKHTASVAYSTHHTYSTVTRQPRSINDAHTTVGRSTGNCMTRGGTTHDAPPTQSTTQSGRRVWQTPVNPPTYTDTQWRTQDFWRGRSRWRRRGGCGVGRGYPLSHSGGVWGIAQKILIFALSVIWYILEGKFLLFQPLYIYKQRRDKTWPLNLSCLSLMHTKQKLHSPASRHVLSGN